MPTKQIPRCLGWCHHSLGEIIPPLNSKRTTPKGSSAKALKTGAGGSGTLSAQCLSTEPSLFPVSKSQTSVLQPWSCALWGSNCTGFFLHFKTNCLQGPCTQLDSFLLTIMISNQFISGSENPRNVSPLFFSLQSLSWYQVRVSTDLYVVTTSGGDERRSSCGVISMRQPLWFMIYSRPGA